MQQNMSGVNPSVSFGAHNTSFSPNVSLLSPNMSYSPGMSFSPASLQNSFDKSGHRSRHSLSTSLKNSPGTVKFCAFRISICYSQRTTL